MCFSQEGGISNSVARGQESPYLAVEGDGCSVFLKPTIQVKVVSMGGQPLSQGDAKHASIIDHFNERKDK